MMKRFAANVVFVGGGKWIRNGVLTLSPEGVLTAIHTLDQSRETSRTQFFNGMILPFRPAIASYTDDVRSTVEAQCPVAFSVGEGCEVWLLQAPLLLSDNQIEEKFSLIRLA